MDERFKTFADELEALEQRLAGGGVPEPATVKRHALLKKIMKEALALERVARQIDEGHSLRGDPEMAGAAEEDIFFLEQDRARIEGALHELLHPPDPLDARDVVLEIRAGAGGDEAALFAADLLRMYTRAAEQCGWRVEEISANATGLGGFKEVIVGVRGPASGGGGVFGWLKFESGTHRVQRVPRTEASGRIHTSTATVAVLPEPNAEKPLEISNDDLKIETFRAGGKGGQHVNVTDSAVRITHVPSGVVVSCQDERSQHQNRSKAMRVLRARLLDRERQARDAKTDADRRRQVGTAERSEKIRTYNIPQNRVTDHRAEVTLHGVEEILGGNTEELWQALKGWAKRETGNR